MHQKWIEQMKATGLFFGLSDQEIIGLLPCFKANEVSYGKGDVMFQAGDSQSAIGIVVEGEVHIQKEDYAGNRLLINIVTAGNMFGEVSAFANTGRWANTVIAGLDSTIVFIQIEHISKPCSNICQAHRFLIENMLKIVAQKALIMNSRINYLKLKGMREKLATFLLEQSFRSGKHTFDIQMNRESLADFLNVSRPSMSRELGRLRNEGVIDFYKSSFVIKNIKALQKMI